MAPRFSASQLRNMARQADQKRRQAINKYNQAVQQRNQNIRRVVNNYNQAARTHNARVRANRQRLNSEFIRLSQQASTGRFPVYRSSVQILHQTYDKLEQQAETQHWDPMYNRVLDLSEQETANSLDVINRLLVAESSPEEYLGSVVDPSLGNCLQQISDDLDARWQGAVFALNPNNPDAARHFCTSAREILTEILETKAPDAEVLNMIPNCSKTENGKPTRRSKINYFLHRNGMIEGTLEEFIEQDMDNIVQLFNVFNEGTHGSAGKFDFGQLSAIKKRVEDGIMFLVEIIGEE